MEANDENMNPVQTGIKDPVQVFCRLRPLQEDHEPSSVKLISPTTLTLTAETKFVRKECNYVFRHIFTSYAGQREVFEHVALPLLEDLVTGKNGLLFTYGVTGSGKTYTLTGEPSMPGIMPRCIFTVFNSIGEHQAQKFLIKSDRMNGFEVQTESDALEDRLLDMKSCNKRTKSFKRAAGDAKSLYDNDGSKLFGIKENCLYSVFISYTEIYNNTVYDLLDESTGKVLQAKIIREDCQKNMYVNGVVEVEVKSAAEAFELFYLGQKRKRMGNTILNSESSRSHSTFNIRVVCVEQNFLKVGQLSLVDLAGSERCNRTHNTGVRLREASSINNSLMSLRTCLEILRENQLSNGNKLIPYRDSRLTLLFRSYFEGEGQVRMIVCVNPSIQDCEENLQVLKFAEMTQDVKVPRAESRYNTPYNKTPKSRIPPSTQNPVISKIKKTTSFSFGPKIPTMKFSMEDPEENKIIFDNLIKILQLRKQKGDSNKKELVHKQDHFRKRLVQINQESVLTKSEIRSLKALLKKEKQTTRNLNTKISDVETANENLATNAEELQEVIRNLQNIIEEKNLKLNQNHLEREKAKQKMVIQSEKMTQELDDKLRQQREHLQAAMQAKELKIRKVQQILDSDTVSVSSSEEVRPQHILETRAEPMEVIEEAQPRLVSVAAARHRRSRSFGEVWLEHNSVKPVPLGTVLQPMIKKRKSVNKLKKAGDVVHPKQNKYCLIAQEADDVGDIETKVYKGDIVPTCGGGAQVIFNDVERLRQESPVSRRTPGTPNRK